MSGVTITFDDRDLKGSPGSHRDRLVISLIICSCQVKRILVDTEISSNILTLEVLHRMGMIQGDLVPRTMANVGFNGEV